MDLIDAIQNIDRTHEDDVLARLSTVWGEQLIPDRLLTEYPRPQFVRESCINLNGYWDCSFTDARSAPGSFDQQILVPFSPESILSGVERTLQPDEYLWYRKVLPSLSSPAAGSRLLLHFGAVDQTAEVYLNGISLCRHVGGYLPFTVDITDVLRPAGEDNILLVCVQDLSDTSWHSRGKQTLKRGGMYYTAQSGIWQSVWMEWVPGEYICRIHIRPDYDLSVIELTVDTSTPMSVHAAITTTDGICAADAEDASAAVSDPMEKDTEHPLASSDTMPCNHTALCFRTRLRIQIPDAHHWTPEDPFLYPLEITAGSDTVTSYCAMRCYSIEQNWEGKPVFCLNHEPCFLWGVLDQGYWPDGLYTAPSDEALIYDITQMKAHHFNMLRKHAKIETSRWYYHCDRLGMIVWQDMVSGGSSYAKPLVSYLPTLLPDLLGRMPDNKVNYPMLSRTSREGRQQWVIEMRNTIDYLYNVPSIATWVLFNEGWGQFNARSMTKIALQLDTSRPIDQASGWFDQGTGSYRSVHNYFRRLEMQTDPQGRAFVISECGGFACHIEDHSSVERIFGYKKYDTPEALDIAFHQFIENEIHPLIQKGLSGIVYTQVSDVEEEVNGILTYDRKICKITP